MDKFLKIHGFKKQKDLKVIKKIEKNGHKIIE